MKRLWRALGIVLALWLPNVAAVELSVPQVASFQGQDLNAFVDLQALQGSGSGLQVQLGSAAEYEQLQVPRYSVAEQLRVAIVDAPLGGKRLSVRSARPIFEPKVQLVVRFTDGAEQHVKLLSLAIPAPLGVSALRTAQMDEDRRTQLTRPNDTLWSVAKDSRESAAVTVQQQMLAIVRLNPDAFIAENVNGLKSGYLLQLPELFEASLLTASAALREVKRQYKSWVDEGFARKSRQSTREGARSLRIVDTNDDSVSVLSSSSLASSAQAAAEQTARDTRTTSISAGEQDIVGAREPESVNFPGTESAGMDRQIETAPASAGAAERATNPQTEPRIMPLPSAAATAAERTDSSEPLRSTEQRSQQDSERAENNQQIPVARTSKAKQGELSPGLVGVVATVLLTLALLLMVWRRRRKTVPAEAVEGAESATASAITEPTVADFAAGSDTEHSSDGDHGSEDHEDNDALVDNEPSDVGAIEPDRREPLLVSPSGLPSMSGGADDDDIIETRLKLAVAFIEVGDEDGAKELLQEVLEEGDEEQQTSARLLLEELDNPD